MSQRARLIAFVLVVILMFAVVARMMGATQGFSPLLLPAIVTAVLASGVAWAAARNSTRTMGELLDTIRSLAGGNLDAHPPLSGPAEMTDLGASLHDLAERLRASANAVRSSEDLLAGLLESLNEAVLVADPGGRIVRINGAARELFGASDAVPFPAEKLPRARALHQALRAALDGNPVEVEEVDVRVRQVSLSARPLKGGGAVLAALDLSPVRRLEKVRRDFVANVSHELRTPLTVVRGFAETLGEEDLSLEARREFTARIVSNTSRMQRIVDDLLDLSRIESGGWVPEPSRVDFRALASDLLAHSGGQASDKGIALKMEVAPGADFVHADRVALTQTLANLVENAMRHTSEGIITVFAEPASDGVWIGVRDTGSGIPREHLSRIFERFYRADPGRSRDSGGTGLGLAIVKHLVEAHGGVVAAESDVGRGTTVRAFFPSA
jgi:two-component system, OmpR family, phosphate regulon sensor histidine kinase PhoR